MAAVKNTVPLNDGPSAEVAVILKLGDKTREGTLIPMLPPKLLVEFADMLLRLFAVNNGEVTLILPPSPFELVDIILVPNSEIKLLELKNIDPPLLLLDVAETIPSFRFVSLVSITRSPPVLRPLFETFIIPPLTNSLFAVIVILPDFPDKLFSILKD